MQSDDELIERLKDLCRDWDGSEMTDESLTRIDVTCGEIRLAAERLTALSRPTSPDVRKEVPG